MPKLLKRTVATASAYGTWVRAQVSGTRPRVAAPTGQRPHLVMLVGTFPPAVDGGVYRPLSFVRHAAARGWRVTVLPSPRSSEIDDAGAYLHDQIPKEVTVHTPLPLSDRPFARCFPQIDGSATVAIDKYRVAIRLARSDPGVILLATGPSFDNFISGYYAAKLSGRPLVLDYRDEWTECPHDFVRAGRFDRAFETKALAAADLVLFTTESMLEHQCRSFTELSRDKCRVVPNGWEPQDFQNAAAVDDDAQLQETLRISYFGYLGPSSNLQELLVTLQTLTDRRPDLAGRFTFDFVGKIDEPQRKLLAQSRRGLAMHVGRQLSKPKALEKMRHSDALLLLGRRNLNRGVPGKLFEYVAVGRPVLAFGAGPEVRRVVERLGIGWVVEPNDHHGLEEALEAQVSGTEIIKNAAEGLREQFLRDHEREQIATRLFEMLEETLVGSGHDLKAGSRSRSPQVRTPAGQPNGLKRVWPNYGKAVHLKFLARTRISRAWRRSRAAIALRLMQRSGHPGLNAVASSVDTGQRLSTMEREWVHKIEELRSDLEGSLERIAHVDHGAGRPEDEELDQASTTRPSELRSISSITRIASKPLPWCLFLFRLVRSVRPDTCIELGTAVGISAAYQSAALACNARGRLVTLEGSSALASIAKENLSRLGLDVAVEIGRFQDILQPTLRRLARVEFAYIDGHHEKLATLAYFELLADQMTDGLIVLDDIDWSPGMRAAWKSICDDRRVSHAVDIASDAGSMGIAVIDNNVTAGRRYRIRLTGAEPKV